MVLSNMSSWILIIYLLLPSGKSVFIVPQATFQSQTECEITRIDTELYFSNFKIHAITCARLPAEREA